MDVGSNTVHLVAVNASQGGRPASVSDWKTTLKLVEYLDASGAIAETGVRLEVLSGKDQARLTHQWFDTDPPARKKINVLRDFIDAELVDVAQQVNAYGPARGLRQLIAFISRMTAADRAELEGVSSDRSHQIVAGALVAESAMRALNIERLEICPWALREGVILRRTEQGIVPEETSKGDE